MQFYKSQWEAQQQRTQLCERQLKKAKRELDHKDAQLRESRNFTQELLLDIHAEQVANQDFQSRLLQVTQANSVLEHHSFSQESTIMRFMEVIDSMMKDHPEINEEYSNQFSSIAEDALNDRMASGIDGLLLLSEETQSDGSETETEPDDEIEV